MFLENLGASNTTNTDFLQERRKTPRCVLGFDQNHYDKKQDNIVGVKAVWEDRSESNILDMNLSGLVMARQGGLAQLLTKAKCGMVFKLNLQFDQIQEKELSRQSLAVRILDLQSGVVFGMFDSISAGGRLHLPQDVKDQLVVQNWVRREPQGLELQYQNSYWFHGPFDTNLVVTSESSGLLEYDGLLMKWGPQGVLIFKAPSSGAEGENYSALWTVPPGAKVSAGSSWKERWQRLMGNILQLKESDSDFDSQSMLVLRKSLETVKAL